MKPGCRHIGTGNHEWLLHIWVRAIISRKFSITVSQLLQQALSTEQQWCVKTQLSNNAQKEEQLDQYVTWGNTAHIQKWINM